MRSKILFGKVASIVTWVPSLSVIILLASCVTTSKIETNKNAAYSGLVTRLYVVMDIGDWMIPRNMSSDPQKPTWKEFRLDESLISILEKKLQDRGITTKSKFVTELDVSPDQIAKDRTDFAADREMTVKLQGGHAIGIRLFTGIFDVRIMDTSDQSTENYPIVWRAKVVAEGGHALLVTAWIPLPVDPEKLVDSIITGLETDGLIAALPAKAN